MNSNIAISYLAKPNFWVIWNLLLEVHIEYSLVIFIIIFFVNYL